MKRKTVNMLLAMTVAAGLGLSAPAAWAAETGTDQSTAQTETAGEDAAQTDAAGEDAAQTDPEGESADQEVVPEDVKVTLESGEITITNKTKVNFAGAEYVKSVATAVDGSDIWNLVLTEEGENGAVHTFENVTPDQWSEPVVEEQFGFYYISYKDAAGTAGEALETALEKEFEEPVTIYALTSVNVRKEAGTDSTALRVTSAGAEWKAIGATPGWVKVEGDGITGYIFHEYVTDDKEEYEALMKEQEELKAKAAADQAAQQQQQQQPQQPQQPQVQPEPETPEPETPAPQPETPEPETPAPQPETPEPEAPYEVGRQKFDDCDGSGHGYWEIYMSDGSVIIEEY